MIKEFHKSKNLFDVNNADYSNFYVATGDVIGSSPDVRSIIIPCESNTTYTLSKMISNRFIIWTLNAYPVFSASFVGNKAVDNTATALTITTKENDKYLLVMVEYAPTEQDPTQEEIAATIMLNTGQTALPYEPYGDTWNTKSYSKIVDTTRQVTSFPVVVRPMENTIPNWTIKGNMAQSGTPTPQNPITPSECGDRTENLTTLTEVTHDGYVKTLTPENSHLFDNIEYDTEYTLSWDITSTSTSATYNEVRFLRSNSTSVKQLSNGGSFALTSTEMSEIVSIAFYFGRNNTNGRMYNFMLNAGSTALPYQPYGYVLPIKTGSTTTPVYLGETQTTRKIKKLVFTGQENWTVRSGTPENVFFIERQSVDCINNAAICSHYANQDSGGFDVLQDKHFLVRIAASGDKSYMGIRDSSYPSTNAGVAQFKQWLQQQYANGTPVTVWYVLATETTTTLNEPLRKIGTYSDSVSGTNLSVTAHSPTTIDVDTSLKPSEMDLTYTGLKMCKRKKRVNGAWV